MKNQLLLLILLASASPAGGENSTQQNWEIHGLNHAETRHSQLANINRQNINKLGLAWYFETGSKRGLEATPLVIDGVIYFSGTWSKVFANNAKTGEPLWEFDPKVPRFKGANACCDVVNRGVAAWGDSIIFGTIDGRLISLNRSDGSVNWEVLTIDPNKPYTITGAPRIVNEKVIIGNGGAEYGVRGYITAYDVKDGSQSWRFYTVPGNPDTPYESEAMQMAAKTWSGDVYWKTGGGGTVWDSMAFDPDLNLLYFGVGNGSPWNRHVRSPGGGDNLFLSSIVAVNADSGKYVWHYQTTPGDTWDYTATQHMILADLVFRNKTRKVLMQAPKNGFFYVIDRATGELLSAKNYVPITWASRVDLETGRPVETENADHFEESQLTAPAAFGGHNWHPMAFNPIEQLVYIPAIEAMQAYSTDTNYQHLEGPHWNLGQDSSENNPFSLTSLPSDLFSAVYKKLMRGQLIAWDPVLEEEKWRVSHKTMWNGGVLSTQGGLIFQGTGDARLVAYRSDTGQKLWETKTDSGIIAPPITYQIDGEQYLAVMAGWGGAIGLMISDNEESFGTGRLLVYKLGASKELPDSSLAYYLPEPPNRTNDSNSIERGAALYETHCQRCHGIGLGTQNIVKDLRYMNKETHSLFDEIVLDGILKSIGMISFSDVLEKKDTQDIHNYLIERSNDLWERQDDRVGWIKSSEQFIYELIASLATWLLEPDQNE